SAGENGHHLPTVAEADSPRIEGLHPGGCSEVEDAARLEEEIALFGEERRQSCEVDDLFIHFNLGKVSVDGQIRGHCGRDGKFGIDPDLRVRLAAPEGVSKRVVIRRRGAAEHVGLDLKIPAPAEVVEAAQLAFVDKTVDPLRSAPPPPESHLILAADEALHIESEDSIAAGTEAQGAERDAKHRTPPG